VIACGPYLSWMRGPQPSPCHPLHQHLHPTGVSRLMPCYKWWTTWGMIPETARFRCGSYLQDDQCGPRNFGGSPGDRTQQERFKRPPHAPANARDPYYKNFGGSPGNRTLHHRFKRPCHTPVSGCDPH